VPHLEGVEQLLEDGAGVSGGSRRNSEWAQAFATFTPGVAPWRRRLLADPTTSGGLLAALPAERAQTVAGAVVGRLCEGPAGSIGVG
jgi:selenophosphate synthase